MVTLDLGKLIKHKKEGYYPSFKHFSLATIGNAEYDHIFYVPTDKVWVVTSMHFDVADDAFEISCWKDGKLTIDKERITGDIMDCIFTEPYIVINSIKLHLRNTGVAGNTVFRTTVYMMVCDAEKFEKEVW